MFFGTTVLLLGCAVAASLYVDYQPFKDFWGLDDDDAPVVPSGTPALRRQHRVSYARMMRRMQPAALCRMQVWAALHTERVGGGWRAGTDMEDMPTYDVPDWWGTDLVVAADVTFADLSIDAFGNATFDTEFRAEFTRAVTTAANVTTDRFSITRIAAGSVVVSSLHDAFGPFHTELLRSLLWCRTDHSQNRILAAP
jgi:hypothetical protein